AAYRCRLQRGHAWLVQRPAATRFSGPAERHR
ncbi:MAG: hypothetical protein AVDCRST_MAG87-611, partial [uncultured Thermomicrobiales bacterium]